MVCIKRVFGIVNVQYHQCRFKTMIHNVGYMMFKSPYIKEYKKGVINIKKNFSIAPLKLRAIQTFHSLTITSAHRTK